MYKSKIFNKVITAQEIVLKLVQSRNNSLSNCLITYFNQHCYNIYSTNKDYQLLIDDYFKIYLDGMGMLLALKIFGYRVKKIFNATDLNEKLFQYFTDSGYKIYIVGGKLSKNMIMSSGKKINLIGYRNGFFTDKEERELINDICSMDPDVIMVGMGVPRQEFFSVRLSEKLKGKTIICVGNFLEFYFGTIKRIPKVLRNLGIEWIFRMVAEPRRLWKRYVIGIPVFFFLLVKEYFAKFK
jgi:exopolysaccharide biosynthesis WecB/TagA/CpsF family protein